MTSGQYTLPGATAAPALLQQYDKATVDELTQSQQKFNDTQADLNVLLQSGAIDQDTYNIRLNDASAAFTNLLDTKLPEFRVTMQKMPEIMSASDMAIHDFTNTVKGALEQTLDESGNFGENLVKNLISAFANKELLNAIDNLGTAMNNALSGTAFGSLLANGPGDFLAGLGLFGSGAQLNSTSYLDSLTDSTSSFLSSLIPADMHFANGGGFTVGGAGGTDSQLINFKATPGEKVKVSRPGQGSGDYFNINVNATVGDVASRSDVANGMQQAMNGAIAKIQDMKRRGALQ
jgi:hypothetical protein